MAQRLGVQVEQLIIQYEALKDLKLDPRNARKHSKKQIERLARTINEFGFTNPILIDEHKQIIAGHGRWEAATLVPLKEVPCIMLRGLSEVQKKALAIADNRLGDMSQFDMEMLTETLAELETLDFDVELSGFDTGEIDLMLGGDGFASQPKSDVADLMPAIEPHLVSVKGDLWILGQHRLLCGNALDEASYTTLLGEERADLVFSDMPYNVPVQGHVRVGRDSRQREFAMASGEMSPAQFTTFLTDAMQLAVKCSKDGSIHYQCMDHRHMEEMLAAVKAVGLAYKNLCVWDKRAGGMGSLYRSQHELVFVLKNGTAPHVNNVELGRHGRNRTNIWSYPGLSTFGKGRKAQLESHPTVKPMALVADAIRDCSKRGQLVLDPFSGSGTTIMAAERTKRCAAAIEIDPAYVDVAVRRWERQSGEAAILCGDGRTFAEIAQSRTAPIGGAVDGEDR
jgi:DNA modification methylase